MRSWLDADTSVIIDVTVRTSPKFNTQLDLA
jgi:hypothetical protein